jgi:hypothetical protein
MPLLCAVYLAWLLYGRPAARAGVPVAWLAVISVAILGCFQQGRWMGSGAQVFFRAVERDLRRHVTAAALLDRICPATFPDREAARGYIQLLKNAKIGAFGGLRDGRVATAPGPDGRVVR